MKHTLIIAFLLLMSSVLRAEQTNFSPKPVPAPTPFRPVMTFKNNEKFASKRVQEQLKELAIMLKQETDAQMTIVYYGRQSSANQIKTYLIKQQKIESNRISLINGKKKETKETPDIIIWLVPPGASPPSKTKSSVLSELFDYRTKRNYEQPIENFRASQKMN